MRALICFLLVLGAASPAWAAPRIELITVYPGDDVWSRFGHTAVRVRSSSSDIVYSFGYAPFSQPSFIWRYLRGEAKFGVGVRSWQDTLARYAAANRKLVRQPLNLSDAQAEQLSEALEAYLLPGRNRYTYDQLRDNCATRVRDLLDEATGGALREAAGGPTGRRYRDHTLHATSGKPVLSFTLDFIGGPNQETPLDGWSELYLPRYLHDNVARAQLSGRPLASSTVPVLERRGPPALEGWSHAGRYGWLALSVLVAALAGLGCRRSALRRPAAAALVAYGALTALWASVLWVLVAISRVPDFAWNENVLAWLPTDAVLCVVGLQLWREQPAGVQLSRFTRAYLRLRGPWGVLLIVLTLAGALPQANLVFIAAPAMVFGALALGLRRPPISDP